MPLHDPAAEQRLLAISTVVTMLLAVAGITTGLLTNSASIMFDGFYAVIDAGMTVLSLVVSRLMARGVTRRFQYGFWHFEPMVAALNSGVLALICVYGFFGALNDLFGPGRAMEFGPSAIYAVSTGLIALAMFLFVRLRARHLESELLALDARSWLLSGVLSAALSLSFATAWLLEGTKSGALVPYIDPGVLAVLTLALLPLPIRAFWRAARELSQVAPSGLDQEVRTLAAAVAQQHGFTEFNSAVVKMGRSRFIELGFVAPPDFPARELSYYDDIRQSIATSLGNDNPGNWLTIEFTADRRWI